MKVSKLLLLYLLVANNAFAQCYTKVLTSSGTSVARRTDGTLWAKGPNNGGCAGNGNTNDLLNYTQIGTDTDWSDNYSVSSSHVLAIKNNGKLWAWGSESFGVCGTGAQGTGGHILPTQVGVDNWISVASNSSSSLGVKSDGTLWGWGSNNDGQIGIGSTLQYNQLTPLQIGTDTNWQKVFSGGNTCFAIKTDGTLWSWGSTGVGGKLGYLASNLNVTRLSPHIVNTDTNWEAVVMDYNTAIGLKTDGTLWGWGYDAGQGQFGNGSLDSFATSVPIQIGIDSDWKQVSMSSDACVAIKNNATRWGWGINGISYVLGDGTTQVRLIPTQLDSDADWLSADMETESGGNGSNAIKQNNSLFHWGYDIATNLRYSMPTLVGTTCVLENVTFKEKVFKVYPNPTNTFITIQFLNTTAYKIQIYNALGQIMQQDKSSNADNNSVKKIDLSVYDKGMYYLSIEADGQLYQQKIIKK